MHFLLDLIHLLFVCLQAAWNIQIIPNIFLYEIVFLMRSFFEIFVEDNQNMPQF
jgi:hypothetical protein